MRKILLLFIAITALLCCRAQTNLKDVSFGFAAGFSNNFVTTYDYSLSPDNNSLKRQKLSNASFVISSVVYVKFKKLKVATDRSLLRQADSQNAVFKDKLGLVIGLNLVEISNSAKFNKPVDGGVGLGYFIHENTQIALMFDISSLRQMRQYIVDKYLDQPIPNGTNVYNALDVSDNKLFYNKTVTGLSLKAVFTF